MFGSSYKAPSRGDSGAESSRRGGFHVSGRMVGVLWTLFGLALAVALYTLDMVPGEGGRMVPDRANFFGFPGAWSAYGFFWMFGWGAWLVCFLFVWFGLYEVAHRGSLPNRLLWGGLGMLVCACAALGVQGIVGGEWTASYELTGTGGVLGFLLSIRLSRPYLGAEGTLALFVAGYLVSTIYAFGARPVPFCRAVWRDYEAWRVRRAENAAWSPDAPSLPERGSLADRLERQRRGEDESVAEEAAPPVRPARKPERKPLNQQVALPLPVRPEPEVIDGARSLARTPAPEPKPEVEEREEPVEEAVTEEDSYKLPDISLLNVPEVHPEQSQTDREELLETQQKIIETLQSFGIDVTPGNITRGPAITRYEIYPSKGLRVAKISQVEADIARATMAERINILAPIPGRDTVGIEIANNKKIAVPLSELMMSPGFMDSKKRIPLALGKDVYGNAVIGDLAAMPHLLVAGATGSGKSVCINSIISSILFKFRPDELRFILVDPKVVEMQGYAKLPHLIVPVVTDPKKVIGALRWAVNEMEHRYRVFAEMGVRNFESFNNRPREDRPVEQDLPGIKPMLDEPAEEEPVDDEFIEALASSIEGTGYEPAPRNERGGTNSSYYEDEFDDEEEEEIPDKFPYVVIIIDELADLMQTAPADIETYISRLTQKARAAGIHLIVATQTPRSDVVTGLIKANIPCRIAFQVSSALDSRIILDRNGAEKLVGKGDSLYLPPGSAKLERAQGAFISDEEVEKLVLHCASQARQSFHKEVQEHIESSAAEDGDDDAELSKGDEAILEKCIEVVRVDQRASTSLLQRRLKLGYNKAARMMDIMEQRGLVGPSEGPSKPREVYIK